VDTLIWTFLLVVSVRDPDDRWGAAVETLALSRDGDDCAWIRGDPR
jgi:hypothetical protein